MGGCGSKPRALELRGMSARACLSVPWMALALLCAGRVTPVSALEPSGELTLEAQTGHDDEVLVDPAGSGITTPVSSRLISGHARATGHFAGLLAHDGGDRLDVEAEAAMTGYEAAVGATDRDLLGRLRYRMFSGARTAVEAAGSFRRFRRDGVPAFDLDMPERSARVLRLLGGPWSAAVEGGYSQPVYPGRDISTSIAPAGAQAGGARRQEDDRIDLALILAHDRGKGAALVASATWRRNRSNDPMLGYDGPGIELRSSLEATHGFGLRAELRERAAAAGLAKADRVRMEQHVERIQAANLPVRPVLDRYLQGLAKAVPFSRIESVVDQLETRLRDSADRVDEVFPLVRARRDPQVRLTLIDDGAYAIGAGVPPTGVAAMLRLAEKEQDGPVAAVAPVLAVGCLASSGMAPDWSLDFVREAWECGFRATELERLGRGLAESGRSGQGPPPAAIDRLRGMMREGADRERILRHLDTMRGPDGYRGPGMGPGQDPGQMHGPGGPPRDPGHMGSGGHPSGGPRSGM